MGKMPTLRFGQGLMLGDLPNAQFTGKLWDTETAMYHFPHRQYSPASARWLTRDPLGMVDGPNMYGYVMGNSVNRWDPMGLCCRGTEFSKEFDSENGIADCQCCCYRLFGQNEQWFKICIEVCSGYPHNVRELLERVREIALDTILKPISKPILVYGCGAGHKVKNGIKGDLALMLLAFLLLAFTSYRRRKAYDVRIGG